MKKYKGSFSERSIGKCVFRNKNDIIRIIINYVKFITVMDLEFDESKEIQSILYIDKMSRLFISNDKSIHSFQFPFYVSKVNEEFKVYSKDLEMDSKATSLILSFFEMFDGSESMDDMYDCFIKVLDEYNVKNPVNENMYWNAIYELLIFEPGYVRYDIDFSDRMDLVNHPPYHLDINYNNASTFKIGLSKELDFDEFINILNINEKCYFLK